MSRCNIYACIDVIDFYPLSGYIRMHIVVLVVESPQFFVVVDGETSCPHL